MLLVMFLLLGGTSSQTAVPQTPPATMHILV